MNQTFKLLEQDHDKVKQIIADLLDTTSAAKVKRRDLLKTLKTELKSHEKIEEDIVYPALEEKNITKDLTLEAYEEHHNVDVILDELESLEFNDESWKAKLKVLESSLFHHIKEEEGELFVKAEKALTKDELNSVEKEITEAKANVN